MTHVTLPCSRQNHRSQQFTSDPNRMGNPCLRRTRQPWHTPSTFDDEHDDREHALNTFKWTQRLNRGLWLKVRTQNTIVWWLGHRWKSSKRDNIDLKRTGTTIAETLKVHSEVAQTLSERVDESGTTNQIRLQRIKDVFL